MKILVAALVLCAALGARAADTLAKELEPLRPFIGKTWKGQFKDSTPEKPKVDVAKWERALNGQAVRILHSVDHHVESQEPAPGVSLLHHRGFHDPRHHESGR